MSKLLRTKPSTLCKAHIFLILFLLSVCNPMSVAGAEKADMTPDEANAYLIKEFDELLGLGRTRDAFVDYHPMFPFFQGAIGNLMNQEASRQIDDMLKALEGYSSTVLSEYRKEALVHSSFDPSIPEKFKIPEHEYLQKKLMIAVSRGTFNQEVYNKVQELLTLIGHETTLLYALMAVTLNNQPKNTHALWPLSKEKALKIPGGSTNELLPQTGATPETTERCIQFVFGELPKHQDLVIQFLRVQGKRLEIQKRVFDDIQKDLGFLDNFYVPSLICGTLDEQIKQNASLRERMDLFISEWDKQYTDLEKQVSLLSLPDVLKLTELELKKELMLFLENNPNIGPRDSTLETCLAGHLIYKDLVCLVRQVYVNKRGDSATDTKKPEIGGFQLIDLSQIPVEIPKQLKTSKSIEAEQHRNLSPAEKHLVKFFSDILSDKRSELLEESNKQRESQQTVSPKQLKPSKILRKLSKILSKLLSPFKSKREEQYEAFIEELYIARNKQIESQQTVSLRNVQYFTDVIQHKAWLEASSTYSYYLTLKKLRGSQENIKHIKHESLYYVSTLPDRQSRKADLIRGIYLVDSSYPSDRVPSFYRGDPLSKIFDPDAYGQPRLAEKTRVTRGASDVPLPKTRSAATPCVKLPATGLAATLDVPLPKTGSAAATPGVKLLATGRAATPVPVPRTPSKSAATPKLPSPWNWDNMKTFARVSGNYVWVRILSVIVVLYLCFSNMHITLFYLLRNRKTSNGKNDTVTTKIFYRRFLLASFVLIALMLIYLYA